MAPIELFLPESVFGLAIVEPTVLDRKADGTFIYFGEISKAYLMLAMTYLVQILFIWEIWKVDEEKAGKECPDTFLWLQLTCVFIFEVAIFTEVQNAINLMLLLWEQPSAAWAESHKGSYTRMKETVSIGSGDNGGGAIMQEEDDSKLGQAMRVAKIKSELDVKVWSLEGISRFMKFWNIVGIAIPRFIVCAILAYTGSQYIASSESAEDMFLNTLAVNFVLELDAIFYHAFTANTTKKSLTEMTPVKYEVGNKRRFMGWLMNTFVYPNVVFVLSIWGVLFLKTIECPDHVPPWQHIVHIFNNGGKLD